MTAQIAFERVLVDSSGWLQYLAAGPKSMQFAPYVESQSAVLLMPSIVAYEVYKKLYRETSHGVAEEFLSKTYSFGDRLIPLDLEIALNAAKLSVQNNLAMADAIIYATARHHEAQLVTSDAHFRGLPHVTLI